MEIAISGKLFDETFTTVNEEIRQFIKQQRQNWQELNNLLSIDERRTTSSTRPRRPWEYLNNFYLYLPNPEFAEGSIYKHQYTVLGYMDEVIVKHDPSSSPIARVQTYREFCQTIDQVISDKEIILSDIIWLRTGSNSARNLFQWILPAYIHLRAVGYYHDELTK